MRAAGVMAWVVGVLAVLYALFVPVHVRSATYTATCGIPILRATVARHVTDGTALGSEVAAPCASASTLHVVEFGVVGVAVCLGAVAISSAARDAEQRAAAALPAPAAPPRPDPPGWHWDGARWCRWDGSAWRPFDGP